jgi:hypothetical protein
MKSVFLGFWCFFFKIRKGKGNVQGAYGYELGGDKIGDERPKDQLP